MYLTSPKKTQIQTPTDSFVIRYPEAEAYNKAQLEHFWLPDEITVSKDVQSLLVDSTEAEKHGIITVLKLFSLYELYAGKEYWGNVISSNFPRPEILRMAATFSMIELSVHQPFYDEINKVLGLSTDDFYKGYVEDETLAKRKQTLDDALSLPPNISIPIFSMMEGAILYSSFAFLKHFQSKGKNKITNIVRGINFSVNCSGLIQ